jgi:hypothetical protein
MTSAPQLSPPEQNQLLGEIATLLVEELPQGWRRVVMDFMIIGRHANVAAAARMADGTTHQLNLPQKIAPLFSRLRRGMYTPGLGTWYSLELILDPPCTHSVRFNWQHEPSFRSAPAPEQFILDQKRFPRTAENMPPWLRERLTAVGVMTT